MHLYIMFSENSQNTRLIHRMIKLLWNGIYQDRIAHFAGKDRAWNLVLLIHIEADAGQGALFHLEDIFSGVCGLQGHHG